MACPFILAKGNEMSNNNHPNRNKLETARALMCAVSPYLYSKDMIPKELNKLLLNWLNNRILPTREEINNAANSKDS